ncbi:MULTISPECIES: TfoX/Sxy family DNA transformation protein [unclassified Gilliamella]|uniref:TfoX/Sxy family DNA transformation protein n=1 Tax=unclassified Gilliamella TaxID=2685620 RepID=UPI001C69B247|nr:TfoX/Sxy family DNA transformation protein [Gilliamella sp. ESL0441]QYN43599.1 TfoX/Sxy family DNA transformation protein [Gilliamella sp. ESL0441]
MSSTFAKKILNKFSTLDDISTKTFFGGFSINSGTTMFGWIGPNDFYLRGHASYRSFFIKQGMEPLTLSSGISTKLLDYYKVNDEWLDDLPKLHSIANMVIEHAKQEQLEKNEIKTKRIKELPNMTLSLERLLFSVGIKDVDTFQKIGHLEAYHKIKNKKEEISINILFILYSSLQRCHVASLSKTTKNEIELAYKYFLENMAQTPYAV